MEWMLGLLVGLLVMTVLGHGIWVIVARILGFRATTVRASRMLSQALCPRCGRAALSPTGVCNACGWSSHSPPALPSPMNDSQRTSPHLGRLLHAGLIDADLHARVMAAINAEDIQVQTAPAPVVSTPPPVPVLPLPPQTIKQNADINLEEIETVTVETPAKIPLPSLAVPTLVAGR